MSFSNENERRAHMKEKKKDDKFKGKKDLKALRHK